MQNASKSDVQEEISREEAAADILTIWEKHQPSLRTAIRKYAKKKGIRDWKIRTAIHSLVFETIRRLNTVDFTLNYVLDKTTIDDLDSFTRNLLRVAAYMILSGNAIAPLVTNEVVSIIKRRKSKRLAGFFNAVLRKVQHTDLEELLRATPKQDRLVIQYSTPRWLLEYVEQLLGPEEAHDLLEKCLQNPPIYIRINTLQKNEEQAIKSLEREKFQCTPVTCIPEVLRLERGDKPVTQTKAYLQNTIYLQSLASALVSRILDPKANSIVLDLCAAPGSKTSHLAQLMVNQGIIIAVDNTLQRVQELQRNLIRLGVKNTHILLANSIEPPFREGFQAEYVLVDPPCSNLGVIQTRPEIKWNVTPQTIQRIRHIQHDLLNAGSRLLAPGGDLVYSTCSITLDENEHLIQDFLKENPTFELKSTKPRLGVEALEGLAECQRLYPHRNDTEGFFVAKLHRKLNT